MNSCRQFLPSPAHPAVGSLLLLGSVLVVAGCSGSLRSAPARVAPPRAAESAPVTDARVQAKDKELASAGRPATTGSGRISRAELNRFLQAGPQAFIQQVQVRPAFRGGRFFGWRVIAYNGPGPVRPGDIVRSVNGRPIERPEQFMLAWQELASRSELALEMVSAGRLLVLRWKIVD